MPPLRDSHEQRKIFVVPLARGYILNVASHRRQLFASVLDDERAFADAVPEFDYPRSRALICFISNTGSDITHIGMARQGRRAGTGLRRLNLHEILTLQHPVSYSRLLCHCSSNNQVVIGERLRAGGLLPPAAFRAVVDAMRELSPESRPVLDRFSAERQAMLDALPRSTRHSLALQKDSVATALALADMDRAAIQAWDPGRAAAVESFLDGLPSAVAREDAVLMADMMHVPGFDLVRSMPYGAAVFANDRSRLSVVLTNHQPLEQRLGADLIYFNETYRAFAIVQYKMMEDRGSGAFFALPNSQLQTEIARMEQTLATLDNASELSDPIGYRLVANPFFLKFCPRMIFEPDNMALSQGMYLPLDLWKLLEGSDALQGPRGGRRLTYENVGRYLENTSFIALVANGWLGSNLSATEAISTIVRDVLQTGRPLTVAVKTETDRAGA